MSMLPQTAFPVLLFFLFAAAPLEQTSATTALWTAPAILISSLMIAWAAESAQYFVAQGFALAHLPPELVSFHHGDYDVVDVARLRAWVVDHAGAGDSAGPAAR